MSDAERVVVAAERALERVVVSEAGDGRFVHTFRNGTLGLLLGADWPLDEVRELLGRHECAEAGPLAEALGHGLVVVDELGPLFLQTEVL